MAKTSAGTKRGTSAAGWRTASGSDIHELYELSVQDPQQEVDFVKQVWSELRNRPCRVIREDFCGTAAFAAAWVKDAAGHEAIGVDLDAPTLERALRSAQEALTKGQRKRLRLIEGDVRSTPTEPVDCICAMNFSYFIFKRREELLAYFRTAYEQLVVDGLLLLDAYGGSESYEELEEERDLDGFTYVWDQHYYNPVTNDVINHIHFRFPDGTSIERAFSYNWRLWSLMEIQEVLLEAGFSRAVVYWEGTDEATGEGNGEWSITARGEACQGWVAYIVGVK